MNRERRATLTKGLDFSEADRVPPALFNRLLWKGLKGRQAYPAITSHVALQQFTELVDRD